MFPLRASRRLVGLIINTGSLSEFIPNNTDPTYVVAKAGLSAQVSTLKSMGDLKGTAYEKFGQVRAVTIAPGYCWTEIWASSSGGKWTTKAHVENDPSFGPELVNAGGWTDLDRLVGVYLQVIEDETINGETLLVTGDFPVQRVRMHRTYKDFLALMNNKATELKLKL
jgi:NAD(P)-dependent dehydrogenase (short-subunit alcohol dehydrogenase family)